MSSIYFSSSSYFMLCLALVDKVLLVHHTRSSRVINTSQNNSNIDDMKHR